MPSRWPWRAVLVGAYLLSSYYSQAQAAAPQDSQLPSIVVTEPAHSNQGGPGGQSPTASKWNNFLHETAGPLTLGGGAFNALFSQATNTDPKYGADAPALGKRFGASLADIAAQNFFGDFVVASAFHEDPHYHRMGEGRPLGYRAGYAISRAFVIRKDEGGNQFNFDNVFGSGMSSVFSNLYYPAPSRNNKAMLMHFWIDVVDNGFVNLAPEFWPDFRRKVLHRH